MFYVLEITLSGYVTNVSVESKGKKDNYFECQIKVGEKEYEHIYVWKSEKRTDFIEFQNKKRAIQLYNLNKQGKFLNFNDYSSYKEINNPSFESDEEIDESAVRPISSLEKVPTEQIISLNAKVVIIYDAELVTVRGCPVYKRELEIADETAKVKMVLWGDQCFKVEKDKTYFFRMFRLKRYRKETYINTPKKNLSSFIEEIKDFAENDETKLENKDFAEKAEIKPSLIDYLFGCFPVKFAKPFRTTIF